MPQFLPVYNFSLGFHGAMPASLKGLMLLKDSIPNECPWLYVEHGMKNFMSIGMAIAMGGHIRIGFEDSIFLDTGRVCAKVIALFPFQTEPEHWHPSVGADPGKEETIRVVSGTVYFYISGEDNNKLGFIPEGRDEYYTARHEIILKPGDQITLEPGTRHWFQAGDMGAVMDTFSTCARDALDLFTNFNIARTTLIVEN